MKRSIPKPDISPAFTIDDIHKIRVWHYECREGMDTQEVIEHINMRGNEFEALVEAARSSSQCVAAALI